MDKIKLIIGLGNPGKEYERTRHNAGFLFVDELARQLKTPVSNYTTPRRSSENRIIENQESKVKKSSEVGLRVAKTRTFMNESGRAVLVLVKQYKVKPENVLIVHDDIDISWGDFKFSFGRSSAGHKGVESVIKSLKTKNFWRLRIGIQPKQNTKYKIQNTKIRADKIILKKFTPKELEEFSKTIKNAIPKLGIAY